MDMSSACTAPDDDSLERQYWLDEREDQWREETGNVEVENFWDEVVRYAQSVVEHFPGDFEQVVLHLESEYANNLTSAMIEEIAEQVVGHRPPAIYQLVVLPPA